MPLHVSSTCAHHQEVKIVYTAPGIITPIGVMIPGLNTEINILRCKVSITSKNGYRQLPGYVVCD